MNRVAVMNQARGPRDAGVPQAIGPVTAKSNATFKSRSGQIPTPTAPVAPAETVAASAPVPTAPSYDVMSPVPGRALRDVDPMASEVARDGEHYYFSGAINGTRVTFRINDTINGIRIPVRIASAAHAIPLEARLPTDPNAEILAPVSTILFGAYPVRAVMAKIYITHDTDYVDVGLDALTNFRIKEMGGRKLLTRG